jgi:hypothetical protein
MISCENSLGYAILPTVSRKGRWEEDKKRNERRGNKGGP